MLSVSEEWKALQQQAFIDKQAYVQIELKLFDTSQYDTKVSSSEVEEYCKPSDIVGKSYDIVRTADLSKNFMLLDGSRTYVNSLTTQKSKTGFVSNDLSGVANIYITGFDTYGSIKSFTIIFGDYNCAKSFSVVFKKSDVEIETIEIIDNTETNFVYNSEHTISGYDEIDILITELAMPDQRIRIERVFIGTDIVFSTDDIIKYNMKSSVALINDGLPQNEVDFEIDNTDDRFNPDNQSGLFSLLSTRQEIIVKYGYEINGEVEYISGGTFYLTEWDTPQNSLTATFKGKNALTFFTNSFYGGKNVEKTMKELALDVFEIAGWSEDYVDIDSSLENITTTAPMPKCTCAEALQLIAQASNCALYIDSENVICIKPIDLNTIHYDYEINNFNSYEYPELEIDDEIGNIVVGVYHYFSGDEKEIFNGEISTGISEIIFSNQVDYSSVSIDSSSTATATLTNTTSFMTVANIESEGNVILKGNIYDSGSTIFVLDNENNGDDLEISNQLVVSDSMAKDIADYLEQFVNMRNNDSCNFRIDPRLELLDIVPIQGKLATNHCIVKEISISYNGAFKGTCKAKRLTRNK